MSTESNIKKTVIYIFILSVILMVFIALLAVWEVVSGDALWKAVATVVIMGGASALISIAADNLNKSSSKTKEINTFHHQADNNN